MYIKILYPNYTLQNTGLNPSFRQGSNEEGDIANLTAQRNKEQ